jgi:hypothetical protein
VTRRWLGLALYAEGPSDHRFLDELLRRTVEHLLLDAGHAVELSAVQRLPAVAPSSSVRAERIAAGAARIQGAFHVLFVHADGAGDPVRAKRERVQPGIEAMHELLGPKGRCAVAVVPVRETEAWALADSACVRRVLGTTRSAEEIGLPETADAIEGLADPKATFAAVARAARGGRRGRRKPAPASFLDLIGQQANVSELTRLGAFDEMLRELDRALLELGFRDPRSSGRRGNRTMRPRGSS